MARLGSSNAESYFKERPLNVLFGRPKEVHIVRRTNIQMKQHWHLGTGRNLKARKSFNRPMGTSYRRLPETET